MANQRLRLRSPFLSPHVRLHSDPDANDDTEENPPESFQNGHRNLLR
jgi:hypothetical protein